MKGRESGSSSGSFFVHGSSFMAGVGRKVKAKSGSRKVSKVRIPIAIGAEVVRSLCDLCCSDERIQTLNCYGDDSPKESFGHT